MGNPRIGSTNLVPASIASSFDCRQIPGRHPGLLDRIIQCYELPRQLSMALSINAKYNTNRFRLQRCGWFEEVCVGRSQDVLRNMNPFACFFTYWWTSEELIDGWPRCAHVTVLDTSNGKEIDLMRLSGDGVKVRNVRGDGRKPRGN